MTWGERPVRDQRGGAGLVISIVVALLIVGGILGVVFGERYARERLDAEVTSAVTEVFHPESVDVNVQDQMLLWSVVRDDIQDLAITMHAPSVSDEDTTVTFRDIQVDAKGIHHLRDQTAMTADSLDVQVALTYDELSRIVGLPVHPVDGGSRIGVDFTFPVLGFDVNGTLTTTMTIEPKGRFHLENPELTIADLQVPPEIIHLIEEQVGEQMKLPEIKELDYSDISFHDDHLTVDLTGSDVQIRAIKAVK